MLPVLLRGSGWLHNHVGDKDMNAQLLAWLVVNDSMCWSHDLACSCDYLNLLYYMYFHGVGLLHLLFLPIFFLFVSEGQLSLLIRS